MQLYLLYSEVNDTITFHGCYTKRKLKKLEEDTIRLVKSYFGTLDKDKTVEEQVRERMEYCESLEEECFTTSTLECWNHLSQNSIKNIVTVYIQGFMSNEYMGDYYD